MNTLKYPYNVNVLYVFEKVTLESSFLLQITVFTALEMKL